MPADPDVTQAVEDLLPFAHSMRRAKEMLGRAELRGTDAQAAALRSQIAGHRADITPRAERIGTTGPALLVILDQEMRLRGDRRQRRPARPVVAKAIEQLAAVRADDLIDAQAEMEAVQRDLDRARQRVEAAREAARAFNGWAKVA